MDYLIALENGIHPNSPLLKMCVKLMYVFVLSNIQKQLCTKNCWIIGYIRNVRIGRFFNVYLNNTLFKFLSVMLNQKLEFSFFEPLFKIKSDVNFPFYKF